MTELESFVALNLIPGIGPVTVIKLLEKYGSAQAILDEKPSHLMLFPDLVSTDSASQPIEKIIGWEKAVDLKAEMLKVEKYELQLLPLTDPKYPKLLKNIPDPPILIYYKGNIDRFPNGSIAVVGSRNSTDYGLETCENIVSQLAASEIPVVSGGARGIDTQAHHTCIHASGVTLCVLGHGFDFTYPAENNLLFSQIAQNGAVLTQFPCSRRGDRQTFPIRNRIVAGLSLGTIVVEASVKSGAMITARMALDYNREVYAVPGCYGSKTSQGCHKLIQEGAMLLDSLDPVFNDFSQLFHPSKRKTNSPHISNPYIDPDLKMENRHPQQIEIIQLLKNEPLQFDDLIRQSGLPVPVAQVHLLQLELEKILIVQPGKIYQLNTKRA